MSSQISKHIEQVAKYFEEEVLKVLVARDGGILDLGAGKSLAMAQLDRELINKGSKPKTVSLDLAYRQPDSNNEKLRAVAADALVLPFKNETFQSVISHEFVPYLLEDRDSENYQNFLKWREESWQKSLAQAGMAKGEASSSESPTVLPGLKYDLALFEQLFKEINRVLKSGLDPAAEARIYPIALRYLFDLKENENNQARVERFLNIIKDNFQSAKFYPDINISENYLKICFNSSVPLDKAVNGMNKDTKKSFLEIFSRTAVPYPGLLVLQKKSEQEKSGQGLEN